MQIFERQMRRVAAALADRLLVRHARRRFPGVFDGRSDEEMMKLAAAARTRAGAFGFKEEAEVILVFDLSVMYGPEFHQSPWARDILALSHWSASRKADVLRERVRRQVPHF